MDSDTAILVLNAGSSSLKASVFRVRGVVEGLQFRGQVSGIGTSPRFVFRHADMAVLEDRTFDELNHRQAVDLILEACGKHLLDGQMIIACGHRVVHGGTKFAEPVRVTPEVIRDLEALVPLAPLHQPHNLAAIDAAIEAMPDVPQVACFDTAFHRTQPEIAQRFGLPRKYTDAGLIRYGFHGLSYESIAKCLAMRAKRDPGRTIVAHLGNGASLCAMKDGKSIATTMSFTPADGLVMGTRCGSLDPGAVIFLMRKGLTADQIEHLIDFESGLLGVSGITSDMRELMESDDPRAAEAIDLFIYRIGREIGSLAAALGGLDTLVFTGGIGENAPALRERITRDAAWLGDFHSLMMPTDEEHQIAEHTLRLLEN